jgi:hypothetical protein
MLPFLTTGSVFSVIPAMDRLGEALNAAAPASSVFRA